MSLTYNGSEAESVKFNGSDVESVTFNGNEVWTSGAKLSLISTVNIPIYQGYSTNNFVITKNTNNIIVYVCTLTNFPIKKYTLSNDGTLVTTETISIPAAIGISDNNAVPSLFKHNNNVFAVFTHIANSSATGYILNLDDLNEYYSFNLPSNGTLTNISFIQDDNSSLSDMILTSFKPSGGVAYPILYKYDSTNHVMSVIRNNITRYHTSGTWVKDLVDTNNNFYSIKCYYSSNAFKVDIYKNDVDGVSDLQTINLTAIYPDMNTSYYTGFAALKGNKVLIGLTTGSSAPISKLLIVDIVNISAIRKNIINNDNVIGYYNPLYVVTEGVSNYYLASTMNATSSKLITLSNFE